MIVKTKLNKKMLRIIAPAKINLHLEILGIREDGFHELAMVMQSIDLVDEIKFISNDDSRIKLDCDDLNLSVDKNNLIVKAAELLKKKANNFTLGADILLNKNIPIGAGLAGGSADAAATLVGLNEFWQLGFTNKQLEDFSSELGSDISFCVKGGMQICFGRGEKLEPLDFTNNSMAILLVKNSNVSVSTPWAYGIFKEMKSKDYLKSEIDFEKRRSELRRKLWVRSLSIENPPPLQNDLQKVVAPITPSVQKALDILSSLPKAIAYAMSGSGPSCFALYPDIFSAKSDLDLHRLVFKEAGLQTWCCSLRKKGVEIYYG